MNAYFTTGDQFAETLARAHRIIESMPDDSLRNEFRLTLAKYRAITSPTDEDVAQVESLCRTAESWQEDE
jgi:hypothetical protein